MKKILLFVGVGVLLVGGGGAGAWWWTHRAAAASNQHADAKTEEPALDPADQGVLALDPFLVNLADTEAPRFLRATISLAIADKAKAGHLAEDDVSKARVRSAILELLTTQKSSELVTPEGKATLKKAIVGQTSRILAEAKVVDVLFSEFVVQF